ncbi:MAG: S41 family peptidase [Candidatus Komeilibacteria bacterium]
MRITWNKQRHIARHWQWIIGALIILGLLSSGFLLSRQLQWPTNLWNHNINEQQVNPYVAFLTEIYDKIQANYWEKISDEQLFNLYKLGAAKLDHEPEVTIANDKTGLRIMLDQIIEQLPDKKAKQEFSVNLATIVLYNLQPTGRSGLYTTQKETALWNNVKNIDPETNLYDTIGVDKNADEKQIASAAQSKANALQQTINNPNADEATKQAAQTDLEKVQRAQETLTQESSRQTYDQSGVEATVYGKIIKPDILHLSIKKISPTTPNELKQVADSFADHTELHSLILDLRGNVGGSIDIMPYLLGPFIGPNNLAFEFYHQGEYTPYKTKTTWLASLVPYKKVVILQDELGQSSAEVMAATLKKYNVGVLVGTTSRGWGTIEAVYDIDNQISDTETYKMFLVNSVTLRDDNQPIEGRGVDPTININDPDWTDQLYLYYSDRDLIDAVEKLIDQAA